MNDMPAVCSLAFHVLAAGRTFESEFTHNYNWFLRVAELPLNMPFRETFCKGFSGRRDRCTLAMDLLDTDAVSKMGKN
jgi:hypothetical protein